MQNAQNTPKMPVMLVDAYMGGIKKFSTPLSTLKYLELSSRLLGRVNDQMMNLMGDNIVGNEKYVGAVVGQVRVATTLVQYILGGVDKSEPLNALDDLESYVNMTIPNMSDKVKSDFTKLKDNLSRVIESVIKEREELLAYEISVQDKFDSGMSLEDIGKEEDDQIEAYATHMVDHTDGEDLALGEHKVLHHDTASPLKAKTLVLRLPFPLESVVTDDNIVGEVVGYFPMELENGITPETTCLVKVSDEVLYTYTAFDLESFNEPVASSEDLSGMVGLTRVKVSDLKLFN